MTQLSNDSQAKWSRLKAQLNVTTEAAAIELSFDFNTAGT